MQASSPIATNPSVAAPAALVQGGRIECVRLLGTRETNTIRILRASSSSTLFVKPARQSRARRTSDAILDAGLLLLRTRNFEKVTVADIARGTGVCRSW